MSFNGLAAWGIAILGGITACYLLLKKVFRKEPSTAAAVFASEMKKADDLEPQIQKLKEESTRDTLNFQDALKRYRAKYGSGKRPDGGEKR